MILYAGHIIFINIANHVDYSIYDFFLYIYINLKKHVIKKNFIQYF